MSRLATISLTNNCFLIDITKKPPNNKAGIPLIKIVDHMCGGGFTDIVPPNSIAPFETVSWTSEAKDVRGTEGYVKYSIGPSGVGGTGEVAYIRSEEHTSELQSP